MAMNIQQVFVANPATTMQATDLLYLGRSPFTTADDFAITFANFAASVGTSTPTASTVVQYDSNKNISANNFIAGFQSIISAASTTTLTVASPETTQITGTTTQTITMPLVSTLQLNQYYTIVNSSSGVVTINSSGGNLIQSMAAGTTLSLITISLTGTTASSWLVLSYGTSDITYPISLGLGGTNNNLTASNGGIVYSDATKLNILAGTATAGQILQSGSSTAPSWSTSTYPSTNSVNTLLYASAANVMAELPTVTNSMLTTNAGGVPTWIPYLPAQTTPLPTVTFAVPGDLSVAYNTQTTFYTRIGNLVTYTFEVIFTPTYTTASGAIQISLPINSTASANGFAYGTVFLSSTTFPAGTTAPFIYVPSNVGYLNILSMGSATATVTLSTTQFPTGTVNINIYGTVTYFV